MTCCDRMRDDLERTCDRHSDRAACPDAMIAPTRGGYGRYVRDGRKGYAGSVIEIGYCPWCGAGLPPIAGLQRDPLPEQDAAGSRAPALHD